ncbi:MAG: 2Fe-2S iron-sulfur cluster-binding protein, partial [Oscillospiraceae bacterium]|nr:2Fe-2S iron-sulfur cluster-binding protein [Oscillospiraceae bacterium]
MEQIKVKINGVEITVPKGTTALEAARQAGINIPTLCYLKEVNEIGACRVCLVEVKGARGMAAACVYPLDWDGMEVFTNTPKVRKLRKENLELIVSNHDKRCLSCLRNTNCELQKLCAEYGVDEDKYEGDKTAVAFDDKSSAIVRDNSKCILCRRCTSICTKVQEVGVIGANNRGFYTEVGSFFEHSLDDTAC